MEKDEIKIAEASEAINQLFVHMEIQCVVCVDDVYSRSTSVEDTIGHCAGLNAKDLAQIPIITDIAPLKDEDEDVFNHQLKEKWKGLDQKIREQLYRDILLLVGADKDEDSITASFLRRILAQHGLLELSLNEWQAKKDNLLQEATEKNMLILFDQDMTNDGGTPDEGIKQVAAVKDAAGVYCGLLSHTGTIDGEPAKWEQLAKEHNVPKDKFVFIAKERLRNNAMGFARMVKLTALSPCCQSLKDKAKDIYQAAIEDAKKEIDGIGIYDFEHIVFTHSYDEGIWEPDMLFRLFGHFHRKNTIKLARNNGELNELAGKIRKISHIPIPEKAEERPQHSSWQIQREELYEDGEYINSLHLPIELGDIFEYTPPQGNRKKYIVLGQPCDLMVRSKKDGYPAGRHSAVTGVSIAEIKKKPGEAQQNRPDIQELKYYSNTSGKKSYVMFSRAHNIRLCILDICVFQSDGVAKFTIDQGCPEGLIPSWQDYYEKVNKEIEKIINRYIKINQIDGNKLPKEEKKQLLKYVLPPSSHSNLFKGKVVNQTLEYPLKRIGRITQSRALAILSRYTNYLARAAFDRDFGDEIC
ncbi:MAG: hypothetical protein LWX08_04370 [Deltaproteobacteria bacterium]|jgi:hypothetical protein|nr:hypothetical protein [Deltaproteobacteria bacterium]